MSWCMCPGEQVDQAYNEDKIKTMRVKRLSQQPPVPSQTVLTRGISTKQLPTYSSPQHLHPSRQFLRNRNQLLRMELGRRKQVLWKRVNQLQRRSQVLRSNYTSQQSHLKILITQINKHF